MSQPGNKYQKMARRFVAANPECEVCFSKEKLHVCHLLPRRVIRAHREYNMFYTHPSNLVVMCEDHHVEYDSGRSIGSEFASILYKEYRIASAMAGGLA